MQHVRFGASVFTRLTCMITPRSMTSARSLAVPSVKVCRSCSSSSSAETDQGHREFDQRLLQHLVCPLSKSPLRYDPKNNELVCDELQVAYSIKNGIPNMIPQDARMLKKVDIDDKEGS